MATEAMYNDLKTLKVGSGRSLLDKVIRNYEILSLGPNPGELC